MRNILLTIIFIFSSLTVYGSEAADGILTREKQQLIEDDIKRSLEEKPSHYDVQPRTETFDLTKDQDRCFDFKKVVVHNATLIDKKVAEVTEKYQHYCITTQLINAVLLDLNNSYISKKAVTSRVYLPVEQTAIKDGIIELYAVEGVIEDFIMVENDEVKSGELTKLKLKTAFPFQKDDILDLSRIENGIDVLNSIPSQNVRLDIIPGDEDGKSKVVLINIPGDANVIRLSYDNSGSKDTHENKLTLSYTKYSLTGLNDTLTVSASSDMDANGYSVYSQNLQFSYMLPVGRMSFSQVASFGKNRRSSYLTNGDHMRNDSSSANSYTDIEYSLLRTQSHKLQMGINLTVKQSENYVNIRDSRTRLESSSRQLTSVAGYLKYTYFGQGKMAYIKPSYIKGVDWFGSLTDRDYNYSQNAQYHMGKLTAYGTYNVNNLFMFNIFADSQYAGSELFSQDLFSIGGEGSVRGYKDRSLDGEKGWFIQNDIVFPLRFYTDNGFMRCFTISAFMDFGMAKHVNEPSRHLSGFGSKLAFDYSGFNGYITYAGVLDHPSYFATPSTAVYLGASYKLTF